MKPTEPFSERKTKKLAKQGKLLHAHWEEFHTKYLSNPAIPPYVIFLMQTAYFAAAHVTFNSLSTIMSGDPVDQAIEQGAGIHEEIQTYATTLLEQLNSTHIIPTEHHATSDNEVKLLMFYRCLPPLAQENLLKLLETAKQAGREWSETLN